MIDTDLADYSPQNPPPKAGRLRRRPGVSFGSSFQPMALICCVPKYASPIYTRFKASKRHRRTSSIAQGGARDNYVDTFVLMTEMRVAKTDAFGTSRCDGGDNINASTGRKGHEQLKINIASWKMDHWMGVNR